MLTLFLSGCRTDQGDLPLDGKYIVPHGLDGKGTHLYGEFPGRR
jgi:hypothetical protein